MRLNAIGQRSPTVLVVAGSLFFLVACAASSGNPPISDGPPDLRDGGAPSSDGGSPQGPTLPRDSGVSDATAPPANSASLDAGPAAPHTPLPQFPYGPSVGATGTPGPLLGAVEIVTATWDKAPTSDPLSAQLDAFGAALTQSAWWDSVRAGYCAPGGACVGKGATALSHGVGDTPNPAITDTAFSATGSWSFKKFINDKTTAGDLPTPNANTLYVFYLPPGFAVTLDGAPSCGYHSVATVNVLDAGIQTVPYVVIPRCQVSGVADLDVATSAASREIIDAVTDPYLAESKVGFYLADPAWSVDGNEVGDYCAGETTTVAGTLLQRSWSNASAAASHDPCVPAPSGEVYYGVAPVASAAAGISLAAGASTTFSATAFADGATSPWKVAAQSLAPTSALTVVLDKTTVSNGDAVSVTVTLTGTPASTLGGKKYERFALVSSGGDGQTHAWPLIVYAQ
jgi:hypothetical protein